MKRALALLVFIALMCSAAAYAEPGCEASTSVDGASYARLLNMELAVEAVNGTCLRAGDVFSFDAAVGPQTEEYGYLEAWDGSGTDQVAETLYLAVSELPGINFPGSGYSGGTKLEFTSENDLMIEMWLTDTSVYCFAELLPADIEMTDSALLLPDFGKGSRLLASASFPLNGTDNLLRNVSLAAESINDTLLEQDDVFSFNAAVGPRTEKFGYRSAVNGRGVKVVGGGVAQVASVIWLAVKNLDEIAVIQKNTYGERYNQRYVSGSNDAILTDYNAGTDFSFRYTGDGQITISTYISGDDLCCDIFQD